jgi:endoglucanase
MRRITATLLLIFALCGSASAQPAPTPLDVNGVLRVQNGIIVNKNNRPPQLRGISFSWSIWQGRKYDNPAVVDWLVKDFKVSLIRVPIAVQPAAGYLDDPEGQKNLITTVVDEGLKDNIYVLLDWHDHNAHLHIAQAKAFFAEMAKRYAGKPNIIYEIWNEPERVSWDVVKDYAVQVITEIRKYDPNGLIVVGSPHWDQDVDVVADAPITGFSNIAYSFHFYASDPSHQEKLMAKADKALRKGLPIIVSEWGVGEADGNGEFNRDKTKNWLNWLERNKLSWINWNITDKKETTALLQPGAPTDGGWTEEQLTPAGQYIRKVLRKLNR